MNGYAPQNMIREPKIFGASVTAAEVSKDTGLTAGGATVGFRVDFACDAVTSSTGITAKLQARTFANGWVDLVGANASVAITADGNYVLKQFNGISADLPNFPIAKQIRVVVTTGSGDAVTFTDMRISQEL